MTADDHEIEQDAFLRSLKSRQAEEEAYTALQLLGRCLYQRRVLATISMIATITSLALATTVAYLLYVH